MSLSLDDYATLDSPLHRWSPREKLLGLGGLILAFSLVKSVSLLPAMVGTTVLLFSLSRLPLSFLISRLKLPGLFLLAVALVLPFFPTSAAIEMPLWTLGPVALYQSGLIALTIVVARFICILTLGLLLFSTAPFMTTVRAMGSLGLPPLLGDMMILTYRYLFEMADNFRTLRTAMGLRGFSHRPFDRHTLKTLVALAGSLLVRSYEQSERVYQAMCLRGYGPTPGPPRRRQPPPSASVPHHLALVATVLLSCGFVVVEYLPSL